MFWSIRGYKLQNKTRDLIEQIYISPMALKLRLLANADGSNARNFSIMLDYRNILRFIFDYAEKGAFERDAEFKWARYYNFETVM